MLKQPTTTYAGEKSSCIMMYKITIHSQPNKFRVLTNISPLLASNQRPPLRAPMATWSACLTKLPRCTTRWRSRRWRSCLRLDKGERGFARFQRDRKLCTHENKRLQQRKNRRQSFEKSQLSIGPIWYSVKPLSLRVRWIFMMVFLYIRMISYINEEVFLVVLHSLFIIRIIQITIVHEANEINRFFLPLARRTMQLCFIYIMTHYSAVVCSVWKLFAAVCIALS